MQPDEVSEAIDEISSQLFRLGERLEELHSHLYRLERKVELNETDCDSRNAHHERRIEDIVRQGRFS